MSNISFTFTGFTNIKMKEGLVISFELAYFTAREFASRIGIDPYGELVEVDNGFMTVHCDLVPYETMKRILQWYKDNSLSSYLYVAYNLARPEVVTHILNSSVKKTILRYVVTEDSYINNAENLLPYDFTNNGSGMNWITTTHEGSELDMFLRILGETPVEVCVYRDKDMIPHIENMVYKDLLTSELVIDSDSSAVIV